jgi:hypothetical protein
MIESHQRHPRRACRDSDPIELISNAILLILYELGLLRLFQLRTGHRKLLFCSSATRNDAYFPLSVSLIPPTAFCTLPAILSTVPSGLFHFRAFGIRGELSPRH